MIFFALPLALTVGIVLLLLRLTGGRHLMTRNRTVAPEEETS